MSSTTTTMENDAAKREAQTTAEKVAVDAEVTRRTRLGIDLAGFDGVSTALGTRITRLAAEQVILGV